MVFPSSYYSVLFSPQVLLLIILTRLSHLSFRSWFYHKQPSLRSCLVQRVLSCAPLPSFFPSHLLLVDPHFESAVLGAGSTLFSSSVSKLAGTFHLVHFSAALLDFSACLLLHYCEPPPTGSLPPAIPSRHIHYTAPANSLCQSRHSSFVTTIISAILDYAFHPIYFKPNYYSTSMQQSNIGTWPC